MADTLQDGGVYYVIKGAGNSIQLAASQSDAMAGTFIHLAATGSSGANQSLMVQQVSLLSGQENLTLQLPVNLDSQVISVTVAGAIGGEGASVAGSVSLNFFRDTVQVGIWDLSATQQVTSQGKLSLKATDSSVIVSIAGGLSISTGGFAVGASVSYNDIQDSLVTRIGSAWNQTTQGNLGTVSGSSIDAEANSTASITNVTFAGSGATDFALGAAVSVNRIADTADAHVANSTDVEGPSGITVNATDAPTITAIAGGVALAGDVAVGAAVAYNDIADTVRAAATGSTVTASAGSIAFDASSTASILCIAVGIGGSGEVGIAGSGSGNVMDNGVTASIAGSTVHADGSVTVIATSDNTNARLSVVPWARAAWWAPAAAWSSTT